MAEGIIEFLKYLVQALFQTLFEWVIVATGKGAIWLVSLGRVQFQPPRHSSAYGQQPPIVAGPITVGIAGLTVWGIIIVVIIATWGQPS